MQYFKPAEPNVFVGDCMPFFHDGVFHLYYLRDTGHHSALGGMGGHQWAHAASKDLIHWQHHPLAIAITEDWEKSICTGSTFFHEGTYYGFYATRRPDWSQHLSFATSADGIRFEKQQPNPLALPPEGYRAEHYRDPFVFYDVQTQQFHMLVTAWLNTHPLKNYGGCLAHLTSDDLQHWTVQAPFIIPGLEGAPECPDYFFWNGWYYLIFSNGLVTRYRLSRTPFGPWQRPDEDVLDGYLARVMKTASFGDNRRIGVAWLGTREADKDTGRLQWGGHTVFRELVQDADGTLGVRFPPEMIPAVGETLSLTLVKLTSGVEGTPQQIKLDAMQGLEGALLSSLPRHVRVTARITVQTPTGEFGLQLRETGQFENGYNLSFRPHENRVALHDQSIWNVTGLDQGCTLDIILKDDLIDVCINDRRCIINRCPEIDGDRLAFFCRDGRVQFDEIAVRPLMVS